MVAVAGIYGTAAFNQSVDEGQPGRITVVLLRAANTTPHLNVSLQFFSDFGIQLHGVHHCGHNSGHHRVGSSGLDAAHPDVHPRGLNQGVARGNGHIKRGHGGLGLR